MEPVEEDDIWEDDTWGGKVTDDMLRSWDVLPSSSSQQTRKQRAPVPPAANVAPKGAAKKDMAASGASASSRASQGPRLPFFHKYQDKLGDGQKKGAGVGSLESENEDSEDREPPQRSEEDEEEEHESENEQKEEEGADGAGAGHATLSGAEAS